MWTKAGGYGFAISSNIGILQWQRACISTSLEGFILVLPMSKVRAIAPLCLFGLVFLAPIEVRASEVFPWFPAYHALKQEVLSSCGPAFQRLDFAVVDTQKTAFLNYPTVFSSLENLDLSSAEHRAFLYYSVFYLSSLHCSAMRLFAHRLQEAMAAFQRDFERDGAGGQPSESGYDQATPEERRVYAAFWKNPWQQATMRVRVQKPDARNRNPYGFLVYNQDILRTLSNARAVQTLVGSLHCGKDLGCMNTLRALVTLMSARPKAGDHAVYVALQPYWQKIFTSALYRRAILLLENNIDAVVSAVASGKHDVSASMDTVWELATRAALEAGAEDEEAARELALTVLGTISTRGTPLLGLFSDAYHPFHYEVLRALAKVLTAMNYIDFALGEGQQFSLPRSVKAIKPYHTPYHFWLPAFLVYSLHKAGHGVRNCLEAVIAMSISYEEFAMVNTNDSRVFEYARSLVSAFDRSKYKANNQSAYQSYAKQRPEHLHFTRLDLIATYTGGLFGLELGSEDFEVREDYRDQQHLLNLMEEAAQADEAAGHSQSLRWWRCAVGTSAFGKLLSREAFSD